MAYIQGMIILCTRNNNYVKHKFNITCSQDMSTSIFTIITLQLLQEGKYNDIVQINIDWSKF